MYTISVCAVCALEPDGDDDVISVWRKCERESKCVEVVYKNTEEEEILTKVHFQFNPKVVLEIDFHFIYSSVPCSCAKTYLNSPSTRQILNRCVLYLQREFKEEVTSRVKWNVNRSSLDDKLRDFLDWMAALKKDTLHRVSQHINPFPGLSSLPSSAC